MGKPLRNQEGATSEEQGIILRIGHRMRLSGAIFGATLLLLAEANPQGINFGGSNSKEKEEEIANRNYGQQQSSPQIQQHQSQQQCCCIPEQQQCLQNQPLTQGDDLVGEGLINERIVNRPGSGQQTLSCARGQRICCYDDQPQDPDYDFSVFQRHPSCSQPFTSSSSASHTVLKCALVSTMPAASTLQRRGVTLSTLCRRLSATLSLMQRDSATTSQ